MPLNIGVSSGRETVGEMMAGLAQSWVAFLESARDEILNAPAEKVITVLGFGAVLGLLGLGVTVLEVFIKDKREQRRAKQSDIDRS